MSVVKYKNDSDGKWRGIPSLIGPKGDKGDNGVYVGSGPIPEGTRVSVDPNAKGRTLIFPDVVSDLNGNSLKDVVNQKTLKDKFNEIENNQTNLSQEISSLRNSDLEAIKKEQTQQRETIRLFNRDLGEFSESLSNINSTLDNKINKPGQKINESDIGKVLVLNDTLNNYDLKDFISFILLQKNKNTGQDDELQITGNTKNLYFRGYYHVDENNPTYTPGPNRGRACRFYPDYKELNKDGIPTGESKPTLFVPMADGVNAGVVKPLLLDANSIPAQNRIPVYVDRGTGQLFIDRRLQPYSEINNK